VTMQRRRFGYALLIETGAHAGMVLPLTSDTFTIGRELDNTLVLDSPRLSRYHARLRISPSGTVLLEDLNSTNGTFVNGYLISSARRLALGDTFTLAGTVRLRLIEDESMRDFPPPEQGAIPAVETVRSPLPGSDVGPAESETSASPALAPTRVLPSAEQAATAERPASRPRYLYEIIGVLLLLVCGALALGIYLWFAPPGFWQQLFTALELPFPAP